jgi:hypothetical protein
MQGSRIARISERLRARLRALPGACVAFARGLPAVWRLLGPEQRVAAVGCLLLIVSTFGPFTFIEVAEIVTALGVLALLKSRADGARFHLPFGDGTAVAVAGIWVGLLILVRLFDRPLGQNLLALACAALVTIAGLRERAKRPMDDLPVTRRTAPPDDATDRIQASDALTERISPQEPGPPPGQPPP